MLELAQSITIWRGYDLNAVKNWTVSDAEKLVKSKAWQDWNDRQADRDKWYADLVSSINKTTASAAEAVIKTLARL